MSTELPKVELPEFLKDLAIKANTPTPEEQKEMSDKVHAALEEILGKPLEGMLVITLPKEGAVQMIATIPPDPYLTIRMARATSNATSKLLS